MRFGRMLWREKRSTHRWLEFAGFGMGSPLGFQAGANATLSAAAGRSTPEMAGETDGERSGLLGQGRRP